MRPASAQIERGDFKFRLHGEKLRGEFALVLMRNRGKGNEWLLIKKKDADAKPGWNIEDYARSVLTGRTQQEIAENLPAGHATSPQPPARQRLPGAVKVAHAAHHRPHARHPRHAPALRRPMALRSEMGRRARPCFVEDNQLRIFSRTGSAAISNIPS